MWQRGLFIWEHVVSVPMENEAKLQQLSDFETPLKYSALRSTENQSAPAGCWALYWNRAGGDPAGWWLTDINIMTSSWASWIEMLTGPHSAPQVVVWPCLFESGRLKTAAGDKTLRCPCWLSEVLDAAEDLDLKRLQLFTICCLFGKGWLWLSRTSLSPPQLFMKLACNHHQSPSFQFLLFSSVACCKAACHDF